MIIFLDWDGTIAKKEVTEEASNRRFKSLNIDVDDDYIKESIKTLSHYKLNKEAIKKYIGIEDEATLTDIMTGFFRFHYLGVINEMGKNAFYPGALETLRQLNQHELVIISTLREDIISPTLDRLGISNLFQGVYANNPTLDYDKKVLMEEAIKDIGKPDFMIGDREEDILAGKHHEAKTIYAAYGHGFDENKKIADYTINEFSELLSIVNEVK